MSKVSNVNTSIYFTIIITLRLKPERINLSRDRSMELVYLQQRK